MKKEALNLKEELKERMHKDNGYLISAYPKLFRRVISELIKPFKGKKIDRIMAPEMKGVLYGPTIAYKLRKPFTLILKSGRVSPQIVMSKKYKDYSGKTKSIDVGIGTINKGDRVLFVDDVFETGESAKAAIKLIENLGAEIVGISIINNRMNKKDEAFFKNYDFHFLIKMKKELR